MLTRAGVPVESYAEHSAPDPERPTLLCFSHLRWDFVFQRPQHLMSRFAARHDGRSSGKSRSTSAADETAFLKVRAGRGLPRRPHRRPASSRGPDRGRSARPRSSACSTRYRAGLRGPLIAWYYTPMMLPFSRASRRRRDRSIDAWTSCRKFRFAPPKLLDARAGADRQGRPRLHRRLEPVRGQEGPPRQRPSASPRRSTAPISPRPAPASSTPPTRRSCRTRASASTA